MKVSIVSPDLSGNCTGRSFVIAKLLESKYDVEIVGITKYGIWKPLIGSGLKFKTFHNSFSLFKYLQSSRANLFIATKPKYNSFGILLIVKLFKRINILLDIDDWELGFYLDKKKFNNFKSIFAIWDTNSFLVILVLDKIAQFFRYKIVSNSFLKKRFGGTIIPHARDERIFDPSLHSSSLQKSKLGLNNKYVIGFIGTIRAHKGIDSFIKALSAAKLQNVVLLLTSDDRNILLKYKLPYIKIIPLFSFDSLPEVLSCIDLVIIPQKHNYSTIGQLPAKLIDAMAMKKTIISTSVSDIPTILANSGIVIPCDDMEALISSTIALRSDPKLSIKLASSAHTKFLATFSFRVVRPMLFKVIDLIIS